MKHNIPAVQQIGLDFFKEQNVADYLDNEIVIIDDLRSIALNGALRLDMIVIIFCLKGKLQFDVNRKTYSATADDLIVCPPNVTLDNYMLSPDFESRSLALSYSALQRTLHISKNIWNIMQFAVSHPVVHMSKTATLLYEAYYPLIKLKIELPHTTFHNEIMHALLQGIFYEICSTLSSYIQMQENNDEMKQSDLLFRKFLELLTSEDCKVRSVTEFAKKLCITPKYLSTISKEVSGKTALKWIHEYTMEAIIQQLKYSDKSIKEIAELLNFANLSFFGKFVKAHLGMSPQQYRMQLSKEGVKE